jgi:hypothetical protein
VGYFGTVILYMIILPRLNVKWKVCSHGVNKFTTKMKTGTRPGLLDKDHSGRDYGFRHVIPFFI